MKMTMRKTLMCLIVPLTVALLISVLFFSNRMNMLS